MSNFWKAAVILWHISISIIASMAPLMFLVGVIAGIDRYGAHRRLLDNLDTYGKTTNAMVSYIDDDGYGYAGVDFVQSNGEKGYGFLDLRYYSPDVQKTIQPGVKVRIIYIDALISEGEKTVLAEYLADVKQYPLIPADIWWVLGISGLVIAIKPQFVFLGMVDFDKLMQSMLPGIMK